MVLLVLAPAIRLVGRSPKGRLIDSFIVPVLIVAAVALIGIQVFYRRRTLQRREAAGQTTLGRGPWIMLAAMAAFFLFAVFVFPQLVR